VLIFIALIPIVGYIVLQVPSIQTSLAKQAVKQIDSRIIGHASIDKIFIVFFNKVILEDLSLVSEEGDTIASFDKFSASISARYLFKGQLKFKRVMLSNGYFALEKYSEREGDTNLARLFIAKENTKKKDTTKISSNEIDIAELRVKNFTFKYLSDTIPPKRNGNERVLDDHCINYHNTIISNLNIRLKNFRYTNGEVSCRMSNLSCNELCGYQIKHLKAFINYNKKGIYLTNMELQDEFSYINADNFDLLYDSSDAFENFEKDVTFNVNFRKTKLDFRSIGRFAYRLKDNNLLLNFDGDVKGPLDHLVCKNMVIATESDSTQLRLSANLTNVTSIDSSFFDLYIENSTTYLSEVKRVITLFSHKSSKSSLNQIIPEVKYTMNGEFHGDYQNVIFNADVNSDAGNVSIKDFSLHQKNGITHLKGIVQTKNVSLKDILENSRFGDLTMSTGLSANIADESHGGLSITLDSLRIKKFGYNGYNYTNIFALGNYSNKKFDGRIVGHDPNLDFLLHGIFSLSEGKKDKVYNLYADVPYVDLSALNFYNKNKKFVVKMKVMVNVNYLDSLNLYGNVSIHNLQIDDVNGEHNLGNLDLSSFTKQGEYSLHAMSDFFGLTLEGNNSPALFISKMKYLLLGKQYGDIFKTDSISNNLNYKLKLDTYDSKELCSVFSQSLYIAEQSRFMVVLDEKDNLQMNLSSKGIGISGNYIKDIDASLINKEDSILCDVKTGKAMIGAFEMDHNNLNLKSLGGKIKIAFNSIKESDSKNEVNILTDLFFSKDSIGHLFTNFDFKKSFIKVNGYKWIFQPFNFIYGYHFYKINDFSLLSDGKILTIDGQLSKNANDVLKISLNKFDIALFNNFFKNEFKMYGHFSGDIYMRDLFGLPMVMADIGGKDVSLFNNKLGEIKLMSKWDNNNKRFNLLLTNKYLNNSPLNISGYYRPQGKNINMDVSFNDFALTYIEPFVSKYITNISGTLSGKIVLNGIPNNLNLESQDTRFNNYRFTPKVNNVSYTLDGPVDLHKEGVIFKDLTLSDKYGNKAIISGGINYNFFKNIEFNTKIKFNNLELLDTKSSYSESNFYGNAFASGDVNIKGPLTNLLLNIDVATDNKTVVHIPLSSSMSASESKLLTFTEGKKDISTVDYFEKGFQKQIEEKSKNSNVKLNLRAKINPDAVLYVEINEATGDIVKSVGEGSLFLNIDPSKNIYDLHGDYTIDEGSYKAVFLGVVARDFQVKQGSNISFNGDLQNAKIDLTALYNTKASIGILTGDTTAVSTRRDVDCQMLLQGKISEPQISFKIDIPDLDPMIQGRVKSALSTEEKVQKQFIALLVSGNFVPDEQSGIVNNSTLIYSNAGGIISNQINNIFRQLDIPLDLGLNYQPGQYGNEGMFDVALSYQAFHNRVIINGNVGNNQNPSSSSNILGNLETEIKLDKQGKTRLTVFTRAADDYSNYLDNTQRNGLGITYQDEFNTFKELAHSIFMSKAKREKEEEKKLLKAKQELQAEDTK